MASRCVNIYCSTNYCHLKLTWNLKFGDYKSDSENCLKVVPLISSNIKTKVRLLHSQFNLKIKLMKENMQIQMLGTCLQ